MPRPEVRAGTVTVFTDIMCGWSTLALHRFYAARRAAGLDEALHVDLQLFLLEDINETPWDWRVTELEKPVLGALDENVGFAAWRRDLAEFPVTSLLANEAVHAAKQQSARASEELDMALRLAFWRDSRCISMLHEILRVADTCSHVDARELREALETGAARGAMMQGYRRHRGDVRGSPHFFLADGSDLVNPGVKIHQVGGSDAGYLVVDDDDPGAYDDLVARAAAAP